MPNPDTLSEANLIEKLRGAYQPGTIASSDGFRLEDGAGWKCAAVLLPLIRAGEAWHLVFTRRTESVEHHKGQVSFPGGGCEIDEATPEQTALREAQEEIGLEPGDLRVLGRLNDVLTITRYRVTPVVGVMRWPYPLRPNPAEVSRVFTMPLAWLSDPQNWQERPFTPQNVVRPVPVVTYSPYDNETLWGISARITLNFLSVLEGGAEQDLPLTGRMS